METLTPTSPLVTRRSWRTATGSQKTAPASHTLTENRSSPLRWWVTSLLLLELTRWRSTPSHVHLLPSFIPLGSTVGWCSPPPWEHALAGPASSALLFNKPLDQRAPQRPSRGPPPPPRDSNSEKLHRCSRHLFPNKCSFWERICLGGSVRDAVMEKEERRVSTMWGAHGEPRPAVCPF